MSARKYDLDAMQYFITLLDQKITAFSEHNTGVERATGVVLSQFTGESATAYAATAVTWQDDAIRLLTEMCGLRAAIVTARENYLAAEQANREMRS